MPLEATKAALVRMLQLLAQTENQEKKQGEDANSMQDDVEHSTDHQSSALPAAASSHTSGPFIFNEVSVQHNAPMHECTSMCCSKETINVSQSLPLPRSNATPPRGILKNKSAAESSAAAAAPSSALDEENASPDDENPAMTNLMAQYGW